MLETKTLNGILYMKDYKIIDIECLIIVLREKKDLLKHLKTKIYKS